MQTKSKANQASKLPENTQKADKREKRGGKRSTSWQKGESGNPKGAPRKGMSWRELIATIGDEMCDLPKYRGVSWKEAVVRSAYRQAALGNFLMFKELIAHGENAQPTEINLNVRDIGAVRAKRWQQFAPTLLAALGETNADANASAPIPKKANE